MVSSELVLSVLGKLTSSPEVVALLLELDLGGRAPSSRSPVASAGRCDARPVHVLTRKGGTFFAQSLNPAARVLGCRLQIVEGHVADGWHGASTCALAPARVEKTYVRRKVVASGGGARAPLT